MQDFLLLGYYSPVILIYNSVVYLIFFKSVHVFGLCFFTYYLN